MPALPSYRNQSIDLSANQFTGFYMRATLAFNGLTFQLQVCLRMCEHFLDTSCPRVIVSRTATTWKLSVFAFFLVCIFRHLDWIRIRKTSNADTFYAVRFIPNIFWYVNLNKKNIKHWRRFPCKKDCFVVKSSFLLGTLMNFYLLKSITIWNLFKGSLRQFLATESSLKMMKNAFYFTLKSLFVF